LAVGLGVALVVDEVVLVVDEVVLALGLGVALVVGLVVGVVEAVSAMTFEEPNGVSARATETTRATVTAGYAKTARRRMWRTLSLSLHFTDNSLGLLLVEKRHRVVR
jgi:hypothetical protein